MFSLVQWAYKLIVEAHCRKISCLEASQIAVFLHKYNAENYRTLRYHVNMYNNT